MDTYDFLADPRNLTLEQRRQAREQYDQEQAHWLAKLRRLADAPSPADDFPAFLLATQPFLDLARRLDQAADRKALDADTADELEWFLRAFGDYLRTCDGEQVFEDSRR